MIVNGRVWEEFVARAERVLGNVECRKFFTMMTRLDWTSRQARSLKTRIVRHEKGLLAEMARILEGLQAAGKIRKGVDVEVAATVLVVMWLGLVKAKVDHGTALDLPRAVGFGFDMAIASMGV